LKLGSTVKVGVMEAPQTTHAPNHHAHHPELDGMRGLVAALSMRKGRDGDTDAAVELTDLQAHDRLIDIGCGPGVAVRGAAKLGAEVAGVDPSGVMRRFARWATRAQANVSIIDGRAEELPLPESNATVVWSIATVHHWRDLGAGLAEVRRVLEPGGRFLAMEKRARPGAIGLASHGWTDEQAEAFVAACRAAGFDHVRVEERTTRRGTLLAVVATSP
jgi:ubiquinone/menaquinone biosynthesis C-methylase UbiE